MLVQSAWLILRSIDSDDPLRRWATGLAKTRGKKIAAVALARRLAGVLWAMWRDGTVYDPGFHARESTKGLRADAQSRTLRAEAMALVAKKIQRRERTPSRASRAKTSRVAAM
ncbi:MAG: hypothetical protein ABSC94_30840 [Polyangiaceae bacterium]|jgi:hypothetical protein